jgi:hypothetical protein
LTAYDMAVSMAILHGNPTGLIIHDDIQLSQWLAHSTTTTTNTSSTNDLHPKQNNNSNRHPTHSKKSPFSIKLGDFNRATIPDWNYKQNNTYCPFSNGLVYGNVRLREFENFTLLFVKSRIVYFNHALLLFCR